MPQVRPSLRAILAAAFGGIALLAALGTSLLAGEAAGHRLQIRIADSLGAAAARLADRLDREMAERWRDVRVMAALPTMADPATPPDQRRAVLRNLHDSYRLYALLGFVGPDGRVVADSRGLLEGEDTSARPFIRAARDGPVVADVHDAEMLAGRLNRSGETLRLVDLAAPVRGPDGALVGIVAGHLDWRWAADTIGDRAPGEPEILILSATRDVLLGPPDLIGRRLPGQQPGFLAAESPTTGHGDYPGLGWIVQARMPVAQATAPLVALRADIFRIGLTAAAVAAAIGWLVAAWVAAPLRRLADAALQRLATPAPGTIAPWPAIAGYAEADALSTAFAALLGQREAQAAALQDSEQRLRLAQWAGQIGTYDWDIQRDHARVTREYAALHGLPEPAAEETWTDAIGSFLGAVDPRDRDRVAAAIAAATATPGPYAYEYRLNLPDGRLRWVADRGQMLADATGRAVRAIGAIRDITSRRIAEEALRESEARLRLAQEAGGIGTWELDLANGTQIWSARQFALFGLPPDAPVPDFEQFLELLHPDDRPIVRQRHAEAGACAECQMRNEFRIIRPSDGALRWIAGIGRVQCDADGHPRRMLGVNLDVTEARERADRLARRQAELRAMLAANPIGMLRGDVHGRILDANDALLRILGRSRAELDAGRLRWDDVTPDEWLPRDQAGIAEATAKGTCTPYEKEYLRPDGSRIPVLVGFTLVGPTREQTVAFILDLTDRKSAEAALRRDKAVLEAAVAARTAELAAREAELRRIYDRTPAPFHSVDAEGRICRVSAAWLDLLGYAEAEVLGRRTGDFMPPDSAARWEVALAALKQAGDATREVEYRMRRADGQELDVLLRARAEYDEAGQFRRSYSVLFDLTARNRAEAQLREAQKLEALGRIAGGVAHDFNNLLQVITGALRMVQARPEETARVRRYAGLAIEAAERGAGVTRRMLAFARRDQLQSGPVDVAAACAGLATLLQAPLGPNIALEMAVPDGLPPVRADRMQLDLVLFNLALNARDAMPAGGTLRLTAAPAAAPPGLPPGGYVRIALADTGAGMDAATLARATEPYFTTKGVGQGTGLGLSMAHGFALQSGGLLTIDSRPGEGTTVALVLPEAEPMVEPVPAPPPRPARRPLSVLMVEDEPELRTVLASALREEGMQVTEAPEAAAALATLARGGPFDALVTDHAMPGMTGAALAEAVAQRWPDLPVVILTGNAELPPGTARSATLLTKPVDPAALADRLLVVARGPRAVA